MKRTIAAATVALFTIVISHAATADADVFSGNYIVHGCKSLQRPNNNANLDAHGLADGAQVAPRAERAAGIPARRPD